MTDIQFRATENLIKIYTKTDVEETKSNSDVSIPSSGSVYFGQTRKRTFNFLPKGSRLSLPKKLLMFDHKLQKSINPSLACREMVEPENNEPNLCRVLNQISPQCEPKNCQGTGNLIIDTACQIEEKGDFSDQNSLNSRSESCTSNKTSDNTAKHSEVQLGCDSETCDFCMDVEDDRGSDDDGDETSVAADGENITKSRLLPPTITSLFPEIPPFLRFVRENEAVVPFPKASMKKLIWRNSSITPKVVKRTLERSHFKLTEIMDDFAEESDVNWLGCFGRHLAPSLFRQLQDYQKMNHIPGSFELGRKDLLTMNLAKMRNRFGTEHFNFYPTTLLLPREYSRLKDAWKQSPEWCSPKSRKRSTATWIIKPPASARGVGIYLANRLSEVPKRKKAIAQVYIADPYLIEGSKFDLRLYVYVTSVDPLRLYIHRNGLVRFASQKYSTSQDHTANRFVHLTNYSINKRNSEREQNTGPGDQSPFKWPLGRLWRYLEARGHNTKCLWAEIKSIVFKTMASAVAKMASMVMQHVSRRECVHELYGFDILLDSNLRPWLLEVNISPSLHTSTKVDTQVKSEVVVDMLNLAGFRFPPVEKSAQEGRRAQSSVRQRRPEVFGTNKPPRSAAAFTTASSSGGVRSRSGGRVKGSPAVDRLPSHKAEQLRYNLSDAEKRKHRAYATRMQTPPDMRSILDEPTTDDVLMLATTINEWYRASMGGFERVYPRLCSEAALMLTMIDSAGGDGPSTTASNQPSTQRYYDILLYQFLRRYGINTSPTGPVTALIDEGPRKQPERSPSMVGGKNFCLLSKNLGISVKGLAFVTELAEKRLTNLSPPLLMGSRITTKPSSLVVSSSNGAKKAPISAPQTARVQSSGRPIRSCRDSQQALPSPLPSIRRPVGEKPIASSVSAAARNPVEAAAHRLIRGWNDRSQRVKLSEFLLNWHNVPSQ